MAERYFTGVDFKQSGPPSGESIRLVDIPKNSNNKSSVHLESITLDELIGFSDDEVVEVEEGIWDPEDVKQEFINQLGLIDKQVGEPRLTMQGRDLQFVTPTEMLPKTEEEKNWLIETYGNDIVDGGSGDCTRKSDGTFVLRIGCVGQEEVMSKEDVLAVISHEYGHTLGNYIEDPI